MIGGMTGVEKDVIPYGLFDEEYSRIDLEENIFCLNDILADDWEVVE